MSETKSQTHPEVGGCISWIPISTFQKALQLLSLSAFEKYNCHHTEVRIPYLTGKQNPHWHFQLLSKCEDTHLSRSPLWNNHHPVTPFVLGNSFMQNLLFYSFTEHLLGVRPILCTSCALHCFSSVQFSRSVVSDSLQPHEPQHSRPPCKSPTPGVHSNSCPSTRWCHPAFSSSDRKSVV